MSSWLQHNLVLVLVLVLDLRAYSRCFRYVYSAPWLSEHGPVTTPLNRARGRARTRLRPQSGANPYRLRLDCRALKTYGFYGMYGREAAVEAVAKGASRWAIITGIVLGPRFV